MAFNTLSIRTFLGAKDFAVSRAFYIDLGFEELIISPDMSYFKIADRQGFYLQDYYVKNWINNSMVFLETDDVSAYYQTLCDLALGKKYKNVRLRPIVYQDWGKECYLYDPSGILWHIGEFN